MRALEIMVRASNKRGKKRRVRDRFPMTFLGSFLRLLLLLMINSVLKGALQCIKENQNKSQQSFFTHPTDTRVTLVWLDCGSNRRSLIGAQTMCYSHHISSLKLNASTMTRSTIRCSGNLMGNQMAPGPPDCSR